LALVVEHLDFDLAEKKRKIIIKKNKIINFRTCGGMPLGA
jgi:hypothetical protein